MTTPTHAEVVAFLTREIDEWDREYRKNPFLVQAARDASNCKRIRLLERAIEIITESATPSLFGEKE